MIQGTFQLELEQVQSLVTDYLTLNSLNSMHFSFHYFVFCIILFCCGISLQQASELTFLQ